MNDIQLIMSRIKKIRHYNKILLERIKKHKNEDSEWIVSQITKELNDNLEKIERLNGWVRDLLSVKKSELYASRILALKEPTEVFKHL